MFFMLPAMADTTPFYINSIPKTALGVFQADSELVLHSHPEANSQIIKKMSFSFIPEKVAFSYRSKSIMIGLIGLLSIYVWPPICNFYYIIMAMSLFGLRWNCP